MSSPNTPSLRSPGPAEGPRENFIVRLFIAPITFISFLLSLALIDTHNHHLRTHSHHNRPPPTTILGHIKQFLHSLIFKDIPESPYAYVKSPNVTGQKKEGKQGGLGGEKEREKEPWHWHTKQRHLMKKEMDDAFKVRHWVVVFLILLGVVVLAGGSVVFSWCFGVLRGWT